MAKVMLASIALAFGCMIKATPIKPSIAPLQG